MTIGDFAEVPLAGPFSLVYLVFHTFFAVLTQGDQIRCFGNVAAALEPGGRFLVEAFVPDLARFDRSQRVHTNRIYTDQVLLDVSRHDPVSHRLPPST